MRNILPEVVEAWWHECESVGWIDGKSRPIGNWQSALVSYATKWTANARKAPPGGNPAQRRGPVVHTAEDYEKGF